MSTQNPPLLQKEKSLAEELTKSSSKLDSITIESEENFNDSIFGSISEGRESILIQKVPYLECVINHIPQPQRDQLNEDLYRAVISNNAESCKRILSESYPDTNYQWENKSTILHISSSLGFLKICELILDYGEETNINSLNVTHSTPLQLACKQGHLQVSQLLVRSGASLNHKDSDGNTALHLAAISGNTALVSWLLTRSPDTGLRNNSGNTAQQCGGSEIEKAFEKYLKRTIVAAGPCLSATQKVQVSRNKTADPGERISPHNFLVLKELGKGSFGEVFLVSKQDTGQLYAMKVLQKEKIISQNLIKYALTERNVLSYMKHPFIVSLNFAFQTTDKLFLILDYCPGGDLGSHLLKEKRFTEYRARIYLCEIVLALEELHKHNIIFRDLKPDNIVIDGEGHALLTDFGLSKEKVFDNYQARSFCGSLAYLAPEIIRRQGHGKAVDWYLLGVVFYEMVVGKPPYFSIDKTELMNNIQRGKLKIPSSLSAEAKELIIDVSDM